MKQPTLLWPRLGPCTMATVPRTAFFCRVTCSCSLYGQANLVPSSITTLSLATFFHTEIHIPNPATSLYFELPYTALLTIAFSFPSIAFTTLQ